MMSRLGQNSVTPPLKHGQKAQGATLDSFGLFTSTTCGQMVKIYLGDLQLGRRVVRHLTSRVRNEAISTHPSSWRQPTLISHERIWDGSHCQEQSP